MCLSKAKMANFILQLARLCNQLDIINYILCN